MIDHEKNRSEYVTRLEATLEHCRSELRKFKGIAEKWEPQCHAELSTSDRQARFTLNFGGKCSTATITFEAMERTDSVTATSAIVDALIESNVAARLREAIEPEVRRLQPSLKAIGNAGKW